MADWDVHQGDSRILGYVVRSRAAASERAGQPVDLSVAESVHVASQNVSTRAVVIDVEANVIDASNGEIEFSVAAEDTAIPGLQKVEFIVTYPNNVQVTYPTDRLTRACHLNVKPDVSGSSSTVVVDPPLPGGTSSGPVFVEDGQSVEAVKNNQIVVAGGSSSVAIGPNVTGIFLNPWSTQTAWSAGNVPSLTQAGATFDPSLSTLMENSGTNGVVLTRDPSTNTWFGAGATASGAAPVKRSHVHGQPSAATNWIIGHNMGIKPNVAIESLTGNDVEADITYTDDNNLTITFLAAQAGTAYLS